MSEANIYFFSEDVEYEINNIDLYLVQISQIADKESVKIDLLSYIFCSDPYLLEINKKYLSHDYFTDIITFQSSEVKGVIGGDIFISIDRAKENAIDYKVDFKVEIKRLLIHGLMHLIGYNDGTAEEKLIMRQKEDYYLSLWPQDK